MNKIQRPYGFRGDRVRRNTADDINRRIDQKTQAHLRTHQMAEPQAIDRRVAELEREWDIERVLETNASLLALGGVILGLTVSKKWFALPGIVLPFLLQHAIQGWCPPLPILRRLGIRTQREIEAEKYALKALQKMEMNQTSRPSSHLKVGMV